MSIGQLWAKLLDDRKISVREDNVNFKIRRNCSNCATCTEIEVLVKQGMWIRTLYLNDFGAYFSIEQLMYDVIALLGDPKTCCHIIAAPEFPATKIYESLKKVAEIQMHDIAYTKVSHLEANANYLSQIHIHKGYCDVVECYKIRHHRTRCAQHELSL